MNKLALAAAVFVLICSTSTCCYSAQYWKKNYWGNDIECIFSVEQTTDQGFIVAGYTHSFGSGWDSDAWIIKLDYYGNIEWQNTYGGSSGDYAYSVKQTTTGDFIVAGCTFSFGAGESDFWVLKLDSNGGIIWQKTYGQDGRDEAFSIQETADNGYIVTGVKDYSEIPPSGDFWLLKLDNSGTLLWQKTYGGNEIDYAMSIQQTSDGGFIVGGNTRSFGNGERDFWILKLDSTGGVLWQKTYGEITDDVFWSIYQTADSGYIMSGSTGNQAWVVKLDREGSVSWQNIYSAHYSTSSLWEVQDRVWSIKETASEDYILVGGTDSFGQSNEDVIWVLQLTNTGHINWQKTYEGYGNASYAHSIQQTSDGGYVVVGSYEGWEFDFSMLKISNDGDIPGCSIVASAEADIANTVIIGEETLISGEPTDVTSGDSTTTAHESTSETMTVCSWIDSDDDTIPDEEDNCPNTANPGQEDTLPPNGNERGDACDCEGNFDGDADVDGSDAILLKIDFGRTQLEDPCTNESICIADLDCDGDVDGKDARNFMNDFGRSAFKNPCPDTIRGVWCSEDVF